MEFREVLDRRVSCRKYEDRPVPRELLRQLADAGRRAPSGCNLQQWRFIAVDDKEKKKALAQALRDPGVPANTFTEKIPAFIVIVREPAPSMNKTQQYIIGTCGFRFITDLDIGCATMQICLAATDLGLGSLIMGLLNQKLLREILDIPEQLDVGLVIGVGYPQILPKPRPRRELEEVLCWNTYANA